MAQRRKSTGGKVVPIRRKAAEETAAASEKKWGRKVIARGFTIVPSLLLRAQQRLGLNPTQLAVLLQLIDHWWDAERKPFPSKARLSERLGLSERQVQRYLAELEQAGLIRREQRYAKHRGKLSNLFDLSGLVEKLKELEPEFRQVEEENAERRQEVARPRGRRKKAADQQG